MTITVPLQLPPGIKRNGTKYQAKNEWFDADGVRFLEDTVRPIGGWESLQGMRGFVAEEAGEWMLTDSLSEQDGVIVDSAGEFVIDNDLAALAQQPIQLLGTEAQIGGSSPRALLAWKDQANRAAHLAVGTNDSVFVFVQGQTSDITPLGLVGGGEDTVSTVGAYGVGPYGDGAYGVGDPTQAVLVPAATWQFDTFGEDLLGVLSSDGRVFIWDLSVGGSMTALLNAPTNNIGVVVTPERFVMLLGANGDPRLVQWSDGENITVWTPTLTNRAGDFPLPGGGDIVCGARGKNETLIWTNESLWSAQFIGGTLVYSFSLVGSQCGIISPKAYAILDGRAVWMGQRGFYLYDGYERSLDSDVSDFVFQDFNRTQAEKCFAMTMGNFGEVWFFYPSSGSLEPDRYVIWNYREDHWSIGGLSRTAGIDSGVFLHPIMSDLSAVYEHEKGSSRVGAAPLFLESGPIELGNGERVMSAQYLFPDEATQAGQVLGSLQAFLKFSFYPTGPETVVGPFSLANPTPVRATGRQVRLRVEEVTPGDWRFGVVRLQVVPGGQR